MREAYDGRVIKKVADSTVESSECGSLRRGGFDARVGQPHIGVHLQRAGEHDRLASFHVQGVHGDVDVGGRHDDATTRRRDDATTRRGDEVMKVKVSTSSSSVFI